MMRHRTEPARLVLGLALLATVLAFLLDTYEAWQVPTVLLLVLAPAALLLGAVVAVMTRTARSVRESRGEEPGDESPAG